MPPVATSLPPLPQEILDTIIDWVGAVSFSSLKELALVAQAFVHRSRSKLFNSMEIRMDDMGRTLKMLGVCPTLFGYVRELGVGFTFTPPNKRDEVINASQHHSLSQILRRIHGLRRVYIQFRKYWPNDIPGGSMDGVASWDTISPACKAVLNDILAHPIEFIAFYNIQNIPIQLLLSHPHLQRILTEKLSSFVDDVSATDTEPALGAGRRKGLKWLSCCRSGLHSVPLILPLFGNVPHLALEVAGMRDHQAAWDIITHLPGLESLVLNYSNRISYRLRNPNLVSDCLTESERHKRTLPTLPALRYLEIALNASGDNSEPDCTIPTPSFLLRFLTSLFLQNSQPSLEILNMIIYWNVQVEPSGLLSPDSPNLIDRERGWAQVDNALSNTNLFPNLRAVRSIPIPHRSGSLRGPDGSIGLRARVTAFEDVKRQAQEQMLMALQETSRRVVLDVGLDKEIEIRVGDMIRPTVIEDYVTETS